MRTRRGTASALSSRELSEKLIIHHCPAKMPWKRSQAEVKTETEQVDETRKSNVVLLPWFEMFGCGLAVGCGMFRGCPRVGTVLPWSKDAV